MHEYNLLIVFDKRTERVVWSVDYSDWPRMIPLDPELNVINFKGQSNLTRQ